MHNYTDTEKMNDEKELRQEFDEERSKYSKSSFCITQKMKLNKKKILLTK